MLDFTKEKVLKFYPSLPEAVKKIYDDPNTVSGLYDLGTKFHLHIDQIGTLSQIVHMIMLGIINPKDFAATITKELDLSEDIANLITHEVNAQVFAPIRQELMRGGQGDSIPGASKPLPRNVEPISSQFSSAPYQPARPEDPARQQILTAIENPTPTKMITRDNFADKLGQLTQSKDGASPTTKITIEKKVDPYLEPIN